LAVPVATRKGSFPLSYLKQLKHNKTRHKTLINRVGEKKDVMHKTK